MKKIFIALIDDIGDCIGSVCVYYGWCLLSEKSKNNLVDKLKNE